MVKDYLLLSKTGGSITFCDFFPPGLWPWTFYWDYWQCCRLGHFECLFVFQSSCKLNSLFVWNKYRSLENDSKICFFIYIYISHNTKQTSLLANSLCINSYFDGNKTSFQCSEIFEVFLDVGLFLKVPL